MRSAVKRVMIGTTYRAERDVKKSHGNEGRKLS